MARCRDVSNSQSEDVAINLGSAIPWLVDRLSAGSAAPVVEDTDTQHRLRLGEPDE